MRKETVWKSEYFCGNKISDYGLEHNRVDYATLAKSFDCVLANEIISGTGWENWEQENGFIDNSEEIEELEEEVEKLRDILSDYEDGLTELDAAEVEETRERLEEIVDEILELKEEQDNGAEIFQYLIISGNGAEILEDYTDEIVFYNDNLDLYVWGVTHWGTSWDYVYS